ncbi:unnamed protein product [Staphylococcus haemolyticus JCSC1435]|uniref:Uncharacterized protein n=1 Tax=Staphylococcus haemolyticus (strain JCSC1435) TaxID=279808 RepID=Q4LA32_STAHJ|nr:unnamed protein product [Staphylococcus haemolyticus JCSC1435]
MKKFLLLSTTFM